MNICHSYPLFPAVAGTLFFASFSHAQNEPQSTGEALALPALVHEIAENNPELKFYEAELSAARAQRRGAASLNDPELAVELGRKRVKDATGSLVGEGTAWSVSVTQTFEWPGRIGLRKAIANREVELAELGLARFHHALTSRAQTLAYSLHAAATKASAVREVAERFTALKETFLARDPAGVTPLLETRVIEASELAIRRRATEADLALQSALIELNQLRGAPANAPLRVNAPVLKLNDAPSTEVLITAARENNFEFRIRRVELEQQGFHVRLARNERYPGISVSPYFSSESAGDRETTVGIGVSVPLPLGTRSRSAVDVASSRQRQAEASVLVAQRDLERQVLTAAEEFATKLADARRWTPDAATRFRDAAELADRHYRLGAVPIATYVELQTSYLDAVEALLDTQREALEAGLKLRQLTGLDFNPAEIAP
jgi:cobalt-zinc-cadmium efflux system outer membrane protein